MSCPSWQWHRTGSSWSPVHRTGSSWSPVQCLYLKSMTLYVELHNYSDSSIQPVWAWVLPSKPAAMKQVTVLLVLGEKRMFVFAQCLLFFCSFMCYEEVEGPLAPGELDHVLNSFTSVHPLISRTKSGSSARVREGICQWIWNLNFWAFLMQLKRVRMCSLNKYITVWWRTTSSKN